jgi:hypothetical protein
MPRFLYASYVSDDVGAASTALAAIGMPVTWQGTHPYFGVDAALCAARRGGVLVLQAGTADRAHPAVAAYAGARERMFHMALGGLPETWRESPHLATVSEPYEGPAGTTQAVEVALATGTSLWLEVAGSDAAVGDPASAMARVESTPIVAPSLQILEDPFSSLGLARVQHLSNTHFPSLLCDTHIMLLEDWHFVELNEPTGEGIMGQLLSARGAPGIFGLSIETDDLGEFAGTAKAAGVKTNTEEPMTLPVTVDGREMAADHILTIPPHASGGARLFILEPVDYPWAQL